ncbi:hypothetical protein B1B04_03270 [Lysinibacillus sp. KCTC 33748]|uniref:hypothetical protein n=1 Tax=unclassified Lysinibacillus TaxID=2636778 RepID=UPI0009A5E410|nr:MULTISPECIES: hypothetical protein [unclassified Lysinibacillus]OXS76030.1 hypothetical protein B1B04_03270 [Lysinibacillus sp. KCTC 33748]
MCKTVFNFFQQMFFVAKAKRQLQMSFGESATAGTETLKLPADAMESEWSSIQAVSPKVIVFM